MIEKETDLIEIIKKLRKVKAIASKVYGADDPGDLIIMPTENVIHLDEPNDLLLDLSESVISAKLKRM